MAIIMKCDQCAAMIVNGIFIHERGCPNDGSRFDAESADWIKQRECFICGYKCDADDPCCSADVEFNPDDMRY